MFTGPLFQIKQHYHYINNTQSTGHPYIPLKLGNHCFRQWLITCSAPSHYLNQLEQLERLRSKDTPPPPHDYPHYWVVLDPKSKQGRMTLKIQVKVKASKVITCNTPSHASDHLYQIWKESIQNWRRYRADTIFKVRAELPWKYRSRSKVFTCDTPSDVNGNNRSRTENVTEWTRFSKSRSNDLEDISQGRRSSHATHLLILVIICTKYGKNPSGTVDATEWTRFSRPRPNDLEDIGQGQRSLYATHLLILVIICAKYGKNPSRTVDFYFQSQGRKISKICQKFEFSDSQKKNHNTWHTLWW